MTLPDSQPQWRSVRRPACIRSHALPHAIDVLSGVSLRVHSQRRRTCSECASVPHLSRHPLRHLMRNGVHSSVQNACPERAMPAASAAVAGRQTAHRAAPPEHRIPVPSGRGKMQGKIKGRGTSLREKPVCTWGWRGTRLIAAPCRVDSQCLVGIEESACPIRWIATALDGASA